MKKRSPLQRSIRRILLLRIGAASLVVAAVFAGLSYYHSRDMIINTVIQVSRVKINVIRGRFRELTGKDPSMDLVTALQNAINYPPDSKVHISEGEFIYALLHTADRTAIGIYRSSHCSYVAAVRNYLAHTPVNNPTTDRLEYRFVTIAGRPHLDLHSRLTGDRGDGNIYLRAIFALSDQTIQAVHRRALRIILSVVGLVILTALLLYPIIAHLVNRLADYSTGLLTAHLATMESLGAAIAKRDVDTDIHNYRVTLYAVAMGEQLGMNEQQMQRLIKGAFLHDVGKIGIRDSILLNRKRLDEEEFEAMKQHVRYGLEIIEPSSWLKDAADVVGSHHEKYDGSGYPNGLRGEKIPLAARIFAIVDVYDALTSRRPYKEPFSYDKTMDIMEEGRGGHFDPQLLDLFFSLSSRLYETFAGREDDGLKKELQKVTTRYFHSGLETLLY